MSCFSDITIIFVPTAEDGWDLPENESLYMDNFKESDGLDVLGNISEHDLDEEFVDENVEVFSFDIYINSRYNVC